MPDSRTTEQLNNPEYNYYIAFKVDPGEKDGNKIIETVNLNKNSFTQGTPVQRELITLLKEILEIMGDSALRAKELQNAKALMLKNGAKMIAVIASGKGVLYKSDIKKITDANGKWFTADELEKEVAYLEKQNVKIINDTAGNYKFADYIKAEEKIKNAYDSSKKDLYDFLDVKDKTSPVSVLNKATDDKFAEWGKKKTDGKKTAANDALGIARTVFKDENTRKNYDVYLATRECVWEDFAIRKNAGMLVLELKEMLGYSEKAKVALNTKDADFIEKLLAEGLNYFRITVAGGDESGVNLENCPKCNRAYAANNNPKACPHCHEPFEILCWNCGGKAPNTEKNRTCPSCLASKDHSARFDVIVKKIDTLLVQPSVSITDVQTELNNLKNILPDYNKVASSKLAKKAAEYQDRIDKKVKEEETVGKTYKDEYEKVQELVNLKKYFTASGAASALKNKYPVYNAQRTDALCATINSVISRVKQHAEKAKTFSAANNEDAAVGEIASALDLASDYVEAKQILSKFLPQTPQSVNAAVKENAALVSWNVSKQQKLVTYTVIRKNGSKPTSTEDGTVVASDLSINFFEDKSIVSDTPYFYGVFSSRLGVNSSIAASSASITTYFEVANIRQEIVSGKIVVKWEAPLNVSEVEVIRKKGLVPPTGASDGQKISVKGNESFEDGDFDKAGNGYLFICVYKSSQGTNRSKGITRTFKVYEELKPLSGIKIDQATTTSFTLYCDKTAAGKRSIYYSPQEINCEFGKTLQVAEFRNFNKSVNEASLLVADDCTASFNLPPDKVYFVYPVVCNEQLLIVSKPVMLNTMIGVSKINFTESSTEVVITGQPHTYAKMIIAKVSNSAFPQSLTSSGDKISVSIADFNKDGLKIKLKANEDSYITIFAETENDNLKSTTCGVPLKTVITLKEKATVMYAMSFSISPKSTFPIKIEFKSDTPAEVPELMVVKGSPRPLTKNDGQLVDRAPAIKLKKGIFGGGYTGSVTIKSGPVAVNTKFAIFPSAENKLITFKEVKSI